METVTILDSDSDFDRICRLCLVSDKNLCQIFETDLEPSEWTVADKILDTTSLQVQEEDGLPSQVCSICRTLLDAFHKFKRKCIASNQTLHDYLQNVDLNYEVNLESEGNISDDVEEEELEELEETRNEVSPVESSGPTSVDFQWSSEAVDVEVKVEITEPDSEHTSAPRKRKYRRMDTSNKLLQVKYSCSQCDKKYLHKNSLIRHEVVHSGVKFECVYCDKTLSTRDTLLRHVNAHRGNNRYTCETCGKPYSSNTSYLAHIRKHTGERPYCCNECNEAFPLPSSLARHIAKNHRKEKSFMCDLCGKTFGVYDDLRSHVNRVH